MGRPASPRDGSCKPARILYAGRARSARSVTPIPNWSKDQSFPMKPIIGEMVALSPFTMSQKYKTMVFGRDSSASAT